MEKFEIGDRVKYSQLFLNQLHGSSFKPNRVFIVKGWNNYNIVSVLCDGRKHQEHFHESFLEKTI